MTAWFWFLTFLSFWNYCLIILSKPIKLKKGEGSLSRLVQFRMSLGPPDCTPKCRSLKHGTDVIAALTHGSESQLRAFLTSHCHNAAVLRDEFGRTALHMAASLGKKGVLEWLLEIKGGDLTAKDKESGWTALHRSAFYGHIHCLISLVKVSWKKSHFSIKKWLSILRFLIHLFIYLFI